MTPDQMQAADQIVLRFWHGLDHWDFDAILAILSEDCRWLRGEWVCGHEAISASLQSRDRSMHIRHVVSNLIVDEQPGGAMVSCIVTTFAGTGDGSSPLPSQAPVLIGDVYMGLVANRGGWLISSIEPRVQFITPKIAEKRKRENVA